MQKEMTEQTGRIVIGARLLAEAKGRLQDRLLLNRQSFDSDTCLSKPLCECSIRGSHGQTSLQLQSV